MNARNKLLSMAYFLAPRVAMETDVEKCRQMIDSVVTDLLRELSEYRPA